MFEPRRKVQNIALKLADGLPATTVAGKKRKAIKNYRAEKILSNS